MNRIILIIAGLGFLAFGAAMLIAPITTFAGVDMAFPDEPLFRIELRAFYGGLELGLGTLLLAAALKPAHHRAGLWLCAATYGGIGLGRVIGVATEGGYLNTFLIAALAFELGIGLIAAIAALKTKSD